VTHYGSSEKKFFSLEYLNKYKKYYFKNEPHFNKFGHKILAEKLIGIFNN